MKPMGPPHADYHIIYDGGCRACRGFAKVVSLLDVSGRGRCLPAQDPASSTLTPGGSTEDLLKTLHVVDSSGKVYTSGDALLMVLSLLPLVRWPSLVLQRLPRGRRWANRAYGWLSRNRGWISRLA